MQFFEYVEAFIFIAKHMYEKYPGKDCMSKVKTWSPGVFSTMGIDDNASQNLVRRKESERFVIQSSV